MKEDESIRTIESPNLHVQVYFFIFSFILFSLLQKIILQIYMISFVVIVFMYFVLINLLQHFYQDHYIKMVEILFSFIIFMIKIISVFSIS